VRTPPGLVRPSDGSEEDQHPDLFDCWACADGEGLPEGRECGYCGGEAE
jgi:hypothetical protein